MTALVRIEPVAPRRKRTKTFRPRKRRWLRLQIGARALCFWPLVIFERNFGVGQPASVQKWILPTGLLIAASLWKSYDWLAPKWSRASLVVSPKSVRLLQRGQAQQAGAVQEVERTKVGLVELTLTNATTVHMIFYSADSAVLADWTFSKTLVDRLHLVRALRKAGYPAWFREQLYDGAFQSQQEGQPPRAAATVHPARP
ncbi:MAG TPA: hypothetical protein VFN61_12990 [Acidimicrobiales bacterium]|nr:hypothetical protein [Acidimicrobiales bacterium]